MNSLSPVLLSPSSATLTNHISVFDNSDQGSVDSDYTSLGSSKFYGNSGSTSSLNRQGRSQSIDELAATTTIPTRHFNGTSNHNKCTNDPLQFVKIHPNHDLIERAQEQLSLAESRKRLQEDYKLKNKVTDEEIDWSKAVENWRHKREQKRIKNVQTDSTDHNRPVSPYKIEPILKHEEPNKPINEPVPKPARLVPSPPVVQFQSKSPSPLRNKGPARIREISMEKPVDMRGFGFKLDGGRTQNRAIFISTIEEGSPADKAGLCIDDEVISMNDENIENMTFDQVRKILKERNLRGSIKLVVRTYEDLLDDNSQTVVSAHTTDHSRTPSPQKSIPSNAQSTVIKSPSPVQQSSLNIFAPKPYRSTIDLPTSQEQTTNTSEMLQRPNTPPPPPLPTRSPQIVVDAPKTPTVDSLFNTNSKAENQTKHQRNDSPIAQVRSYVEKQMDQLQQDLEFGFSRTPKTPLSSSSTNLPTNTTREQQRPVPIPVDVTHASLSPPEEVLRSSLKKSSSTQQELDQIPPHRTYGLKINPNEQVIHYLDPYPQQRPSTNHAKHSIPDLTTINRPMTTHSIERTFKELRVNMPTSYSSQPQILNQQQKKVTIQLDERTPPQRMSSKQIHAKLNQAPRRTHFEDHAWIHHDQKSQSSGRRSAPIAPHQQNLQMHRQIANQPSYPSNGQQIQSPNRQPRTKSPNRPTANCNNDRVLSVSGRLRCTRCNDELGHGSAMVIESLGLYYHIECFRCFVCNIPLSSTFEGTDVRIRNNRLHCQNCFSDENGVKLSAV